MFSKSLLNCILALSVGGALGAVVPFHAKGALAVIQNQNGNDDTRFYYQPQNGTNPAGIVEIAINGPFDTGRVFAENVQIPANEVLQRTPISAVTLLQPSEIHVFFLSPQRILSEYIWTPLSGFIGGSRCSQCVTSKNYTVAENQDFLAATINPVSGTLSVAFVDANNSDTLSEALIRHNGWFLFPMEDSN